MSTSRSPRRRPQPASSVPPDELARLRAARDELDAIDTDHRSREDNLLAEYLSAKTEVADIKARRDAAITDLDAKRCAIVDNAEQALADAEQRQAAAVAQLSQRRSAQKLMALLGLSRRRVDTLIHLHRAQSAPEPGPARVADGTDEADNGGAGEEAIPRSPTRARSRPPRPSRRSTESTVSIADGSSGANEPDHALANTPTIPSLSDIADAQPEDPEPLF